MKLPLSLLPKTWLIDLDGTVIVHNSHLNGKQRLTKDARKFIKAIPKSDKLIFLTARGYLHAEETERFLAENGIWFTEIIYDLPVGERILINDTKPRGLKTALSVNIERDAGFSDIKIEPIEKDE